MEGRDRSTWLIVFTIYLHRKANVRHLGNFQFQDLKPILSSILVVASKAYHLTSSHGGTFSGLHAATPSSTLAAYVLLLCRRRLDVRSGVPGLYKNLSIEQQRFLYADPDGA
jgi:hypothetical protein